MGINFFDKKNRYTYSMREVDDSWSETVQEIVNIKDKTVIDIGCGGGNYTKKLIEMGAESVIGIDFSKEMLEGAKENCIDYPNITFQIGNAIDTGLPDHSGDIILERALIHHLNVKELEKAFNEAFRLLNKNGTIIIQDRTPDDCLLPGTPNHIRGYFFEKFPELGKKETRRRHESAKVKNALIAAGFNSIKEHTLWEIRKIYHSIQELEKDMLNRTGRSILHDLTDDKLKELVKYIKSQIDEQGEILEKDRWTIWTAKIF
ncbi:class I SAM-dependent methyltransferase [Scopulibacillus cellulosilyticus]|uniref:Class I SAM-dependent methyltransferase n=1 Tax=Scopulibacillus cellulosilyticus TaxID=2665665 RepID=A0ABW2PVJ2_9BACL